MTIKRNAEAKLHLSAKVTARDQAGLERAVEEIFLRLKAGWRSAVAAEDDYGYQFSVREGPP